MNTPPIKSVITSALLGLAGLADCAHAAMVALPSNPATWRVENYENDKIVLWYTGSPCSQGQLSFGPNFTKSDMNRFWSAYSMARNGGPKMFVYYDNADAPARCVITSFGIDAGP